MILEVVANFYIEPCEHAHYFRRNLLKSPCGAASTFANLLIIDPVVAVKEPARSIGCYGMTQADDDRS